MIKVFSTVISMIIVSDGHGKFVHFSIYIYIHFKKHQSRMTPEAETSEGVDLCVCIIIRSSKWFHPSYKHILTVGYLLRSPHLNHCLKKNICLNNLYILTLYTAQSGVLINTLPTLIPPPPIVNSWTVI